MEKKKVLKAIKELEASGKDVDILIASMEEGLVKAYRKNVDMPELMVRAQIDKKTGDVHVFQQFKVVAPGTEVEDDEFEISLEDAQKLDPNAEVDGLVETEVDIDGIGRASASVAKNFYKQKNREAEKQKVYDDYIDLLHEMVIGTVNKVEEKFALITLDSNSGVTALMPMAAQIPGEYLREGENLPVIITAVNKDTKGAQILVSRSTEELVKRLFEKEVAEVYDGTVEIKAIAREAGERTKMAVYSNNPEVDARGACIGMGGMRVQAVSNELSGEKIDIFEWSPDITDLVKNALAPAEVEGVFPVEPEDGGKARELLVVVNEDMLSLAIGKRGKNSRLAAKLTKMKIDIKTKAELAEMGKDFDTLVLETQARKEQERREESQKKIAEMNAELEAQEKALAERRAAASQNKPQEDVSDKETVKQRKRTKREAGEKADYVSVFEKLAEKPKTKAETAKEDKKKKYKKKDEEEHKLRTIDIKKDLDYDIKPEYSDEELEEIEAQKEQEEEAKYDVDYEEYEDYYDKED